ncbi:hypothetical protein GCM10009785_28320 [Brooklawnia cerclae]|uniref:Uncharacterized protein n=1 Tax=Brooklawnia cerclae TaxID=349934 RepID=A0ABX0SES0_9ACTN|nr:hypothetical protein [Brooklawnia cerclae]NIH56877.1 hypothetical protein [Brooklawnia cerclae]
MNGINTKVLAVVSGVCLIAGVIWFRVGVDADLVWMPIALLVVGFAGAAVYQHLRKLDSRAAQDKLHDDLRRTYGNQQK